MIEIRESKTKIGFAVNLRFIITQHSRDIDFMKKLVQYLGCGKVYIRSNQTAVDFIVIKFADIYEKIILFFKKNPISVIKALDFAKFCEVAELMKNKANLTPEGLTKIRKIKAQMNITRLSK